MSTAVDETYDNAGGLNLPGKLCVFRQETITRVNHVDAVVNGNLDNLVGGEVGLHGSVLAGFADDIGLVGLLPVHAEPVLATVYSDCLEGQLVGSTEDADGDFTTVGHCAKDSLEGCWYLAQLHTARLTQELLHVHNGGVGAEAGVDGVIVVGDLLTGAVGLAVWL